MKNFIRALRFCWPYRYRVVMSILCAVGAAIFWSLNFTAIYPVLKIISTDQNLQVWVRASIEKIQNEQVEPLQKKQKELTEEMEQIKKELTGKEKVRGERQRAHDLAQVESKLEDAYRSMYFLGVAQRFIDGWLPTDKFLTLAAVVGFVVLAIMLKGIFDFWQESLVGSVVNLSLFDMRNSFFRKVLHLDVGYFSQSGTHELMSRFTNDMEMLGTGSKTLFSRVIAEPLRILACVLVACWISWQLTLMFVVLVPFAVFVLARLGRMVKRATRRQLERMSQIYKILQENFHGIRVVKAFTREPAERRRFRQATLDYYHKAMWVVYLDAFAGPIVELVGVIAVAVALLAGAYLVLLKTTHLGPFRMSNVPLEAESLMTLYGLLAGVADPVRKLSSVYTRIQSGCAAADRVFNYMDRPPKVEPNSGGTMLERHHTSIEFRDVCFSYEPGHPILTNIHLEVKFGETIALVGKNGCGKSTLAGLICRFYDPDHGSILIDGTEIRGANLRSLRHQLAIVTQDAFLFDDTIYNNISYGKRGATKEEIEEAARQARAHDFILTLPLGYDTRVGEAGTKLSGGQRQRITLARAMLRNPSILILDEFTSAADAETEAEVNRLLRDFMHNRTTFVITHRLHTLEIADRILVLESGRVAAVGTHQELLGKCSAYQRLQDAHSQKRVA